MAKVKSFLPSKNEVQKREWHWEDAVFAQRAPALYEFLATALVDSEERKGGSITLFCSNGALKVCFSDRHTRLAFYAILDASGDLLEALEQTLVGGHEPWAPMKQFDGKVPF